MQEGAVTFLRAGYQLESYYEKEDGSGWTLGGIQNCQAEEQTALKTGGLALIGGFKWRRPDGKLVTV